MAAPATPSAFYKMLSVPDAEALVLKETEQLPSQSVPFHAAFQHVLAEDVLAQEPVPGFRASIKVTERSWCRQTPGVGSDEEVGTGQGQMRKLATTPTCMHCTCRS